MRRMWVVCGVLFSVVIFAALLDFDQTMGQIMSKSGFNVGSGSVSVLDPAGYFSLAIPKELVCKSTPKHVSCEGKSGSSAAKLLIDMNDVPLSATLGLIRLNQQELLQDKPNYQLLKNEEKTVDAQPGFIQIISYNVFGNIDTPMLVEVVCVLPEIAKVTPASKKATKKLQFKMMLMCEGQECSTFRDKMVAVIDSIQLAKLDAAGAPIAGSIKVKAKTDAGPTDTNSLMQSILDSVRY